MRLVSTAKMIQTDDEHEANQFVDALRELGFTTTGPRLTKKFGADQRPLWAASGFLEELDPPDLVPGDARNAERG